MASLPALLPVHAVVFDLDGTLVDSHAVWWGILEDAAAHFGGPPVPRAEYERTFGQSTQADIDAFFPGAARAEVDAFYAASLPRHLHLLRPLPGAREVLLALRRRGVRRACATNASRGFAHAALAAADLFNLLDILVGADEVPHPKPAPDLVLAAAARLDVSPAACVMVGDSRYDVEAGRAAGAAVVGLGVPGDACIRALEELLPLLR